MVKISLWGLFTPQHVFNNMSRLKLKSLKNKSTQKRFSLFLSCRNLSTVYRTFDCQWRGLPFSQWDPDFIQSMSTCNPASLFRSALGIQSINHWSLQHFSQQDIVSFLLSYISDKVAESPWFPVTTVTLMKVRRCADWCLGSLFVVLWTQDLLIKVCVCVSVCV